MNLLTFCIVTLGGIRCYVKATNIDDAMAKLQAEFFGGQPTIIDWYILN